MHVKFLLVCEGTSDRGLVPHLEELCVRAGASEAMGDAPDLTRLRPTPSRTIDSKAAAALLYAGDVNLIFVHMDADNRDPDDVRKHIKERMSSVANCPPHVCVVPVQELESWLLADAAAIRAVVGNPSGRNDLNLPARQRIEKTPKAKERLKAALASASEETGSRLQKVKNRFPELRAILLQRLDIDGPINELKAWQALVMDVNDAVAALVEGQDAK